MSNIEAIRGWCMCPSESSVASRLICVLGRWCDDIEEKGDTHPKANMNDMRHRSAKSSSSILPPCLFSSVPVSTPAVAPVSVSLPSPSLSLSPFHFLLSLLTRANFRSYCGASAVKNEASRKMI